MSPDQIDQAILAHCKPPFLKVARVIGNVAAALKAPIKADKDFIFIVDRIKALARAGKLESAGDVDWRTFGEIRLREKNASHAASEASRPQKPEQGT
jgi:uncharacterized protein DUF3658